MSAFQHNRFLGIEALQADGAGNIFTLHNEWFIIIIDFTVLFIIDNIVLTTWVDKNVRVLILISFYWGYWRITRVFISFQAVYEYYVDRNEYTGKD